jgi:O-acetyl-ADP-ribose deacetylase (regulator of RNase III)
MIRERWPNVYEVYALRHKIFGLQLGEIIPVQTTDGKLILNCISQENYGRNGSRFVDYDAVFKIFTQINHKVLDWEVNEVSLPRIGAGLGGGDWNVISAIVQDTATNYTPVVWDYDQAVI